MTITIVSPSFGKQTFECDGWRVSNGGMISLARKTDDDTWYDFKMIGPGAWDDIDAPRGMEGDMTVYVPK